MNLFLRFALVYIVSFSMTDSAKILLVPGQVKSHLNYFFSFGNALVSAGHQVYSTSASLKALSTSGTNEKFTFLEFYVPENATLMGIPKTTEKLFTDFFIDGVQLDLAEMSTYVKEECRLMMADANFLNKVSSLKFDLVVADGFIVSPCFSLIPTYLQLPYVILTRGTFFVEVRLPVLPSFVPMGITETGDRMTLKESVINFLMWLIVQMYIPMPGITDTSLLRKYMLDSKLRQWDKLTRNAELIFVTQDHILEWIVPSMPHVVTLACITCRPAKELPEELQKFADEARNGLIIVTFGSVVHFVPEAITLKFMEAFAQSGMRVIWKYPGVKAPEYVPSNVKLMEWIPQNDLLGHPNTKVFITHCGNNGQHEAVYNGVPMIAFPMYADQTRNAANLVLKTIGIRQDITSFTVGDLVSAIHTIAPANGTSSKYTINTRKLSALLKNVKETANDKIIQRINSVLKFGSKHLRSSALDLPLYQFYAADIFALITVVVMTSLYSVRLCCKCLA